MKTMSPNLSCIPLFLLAIIFFAAAHSATAKNKITYQDTWGNHGLTLKQQKSIGVSLNFSVKDFAFEDRIINGETMKEISFAGSFLQSNEGVPNLPCISRYIAIPQGATATLEIVKSRTEVMQNINIAPVPKILMDNERGPTSYKKDMSIYSKNALYPQQPVILSQKTQIRGVDVVLISITPYQFNPISKELIIYRDMEIKVNFTGGNGQFSDNRLRSRFWDPILKDNIFNSESLPAINYDAQIINQNNSDEAGCEYLIIIPTDPAYKQWADSLSAFRTEQGILTKIVTTAEIGGNTSAAIESYINNAYNNWSIPPSACLLMADHGTNQATNIVSNILNDHPDKYRYVSDNPYADVTGDNLPDIAFARMTANNVEQLQTMVTKCINYERNPPTKPEFYKKPVTATGWQTDCWYQLCSEIVGGFWKKVKGKEPVRINEIYEGTPDIQWSTAPNTNTIIDYFGPAGLAYIPATPDELGRWTGGKASDINNAMNSGSFMVLHRDHGDALGWGEPAYTDKEINGLTNTDLSFIMSLNCQTGKFDFYRDCFAEKFHKYIYNGKNAGALGLIAATEVSYSFMNDTYAWGMYDNLWTDFMPSYGTSSDNRSALPAFGNSAGKYFLQQSSWPANPEYKKITYNLFHFHGDAFQTIFSEVPQKLTVSHARAMFSGSSTLNVTADAGSFIAFTVNNQIIGTANGTGNPVAVSVIPQPIGTVVKVVVTKQNYYRHYSDFIVASPDKPFVTTQMVAINDVKGNNNQRLETGEEAFLELTEKNLGNAASLNTVVTLSSSDPYITLVNKTTNYGTVSPQEIVNIPNGFEIHIANNVPNMHSALVTAIATNGTDTWKSNFQLECLAPALSAGSLLIDDSKGGNGNGRLDPDETADIKIVNINTGLAPATGAISRLSINSEFLTLNQSTYNSGTINPSGSQTALFNVTVNPLTPAGLMVYLNYSLTSGAYSVQKSYVVQAGALVEDWESGNFSKFNWTFGGSQPWIINNTGSYEGNFSAKSGTVANSGNSQLILQYKVPETDSIKFAYKVSSEINKDMLKFYIDTVLMGTYSGYIDWSQLKFPVNAGLHIFKWIYSKDDSGSRGSDCAWIDFIRLPLPLVTTCSAGADSYTCENSTFQCEGKATNYTTLKWTSSGTGKFNNINLLNPVYTPSAADISLGLVTLSLSATGASGTSTDDMLLQIHKVPNPAITGLNTSCTGTTNIYKTANFPGCSYFWNINGAEITTGQNTNEISVNWVTPGTNNIIVVITDKTTLCSKSVNFPVTVNSFPQTPESPQGPAKVDLNSVSRSDYYYPFMQANYTWQLLPAEAGLIVGYGYYATVVWASNYRGDVTIRAKTANNCGESNWSDAFVTNVFNSVVGIDEKQRDVGISLIPNPNDGNFTVEVSTLGKSLIDMRIIAANGATVFEKTRVLSDGKYVGAMNLNLAPGSYTLIVVVNNVSKVHKFVVK
jgi:hypothetical protein